MHAPSDAPSPAAAELCLADARDGRRAEPVTCGLPWPRGVLAEASRLRLHNGRGEPALLQVRALDRWPDGSVRWALLDWLADGGPAVYRVTVAPEAAAASGGGALHAAAGAAGVRVDTGAARFDLRPGGRFPLESAVVAGGEAIDAGRTRFVVEDEAGRTYEPAMRRVVLEEDGPVRAAVLCEGVVGRPGAAPLLDFIARLHFFAGSSAVRFVLTLQNPRKAEHPGGLWDLGNGGAVYLRDAALTLALPAGGGRPTARCSAEIGAPFEDVGLPLEVYQDSSGGENWRSHNHFNRRREIPNTFRGYRLRAGGAERTGLRATPAVGLTRDGRALAVAMEYFWQNFPKALEAADDSVTLRLFPRQYADVHELQGGEQKTHTFYIAFGPEAAAAAPLAWAAAPQTPYADPAWYCATGAVPCLTPRGQDPHADYLRLVDAAVEGGDTFERKREVIDEYGWRHFGDVYGDHEAVFHKGPAPLVSHFNNQYDQVAGFAYQFLRSGDLRWWRAMGELAAHVIDIDIYHTDRDKAAYNHGLFWHTFHYVDADTGTHRSYPRRYAERVKGGGPADEQNYTTGLMLHHFLTGDALSREAAVGLAQWVVDMDDGRRTVFRWLAGGATGLASKSRSEDYNGPGRGAANSVAALLDGHRLTGEARFLDKAEELIRRVIHPADDVAARVALRSDRKTIDAENRWFYTMFLQSLGRYLDYKAELGRLDSPYAYARAALLHYARWMDENEYPYLEKPEILDYPTETWAAQDLRKCEVFQCALKHAAGEERARFTERADFFFRHATAALGGMKTRALARPVALLLSFGFSRAYFERHPDVAAPPPESQHDFGRPEVFVPQKARAKRRVRLLAAGAAALSAALAAGLLAWLVWPR
jgi:hypothetical protein